jgi:hypothetical protein
VGQLAALNVLDFLQRLRVIHGFGSAGSDKTVEEGHARGLEIF